ncbi:protein of unknown function [Nitrospira japonica]|uniref:Uncharacterized protein n=1 Tax=Nitrospira japonica TaxID=1325564 RepID=A0A1W1I0N5_9BACT|nr:protein of unknown function [Nitrospira japonica]
MRTIWFMRDVYLKRGDFLSFGYLLSSYGFGIPLGGHSKCLTGLFRCHWNEPSLGICPFNRIIFPVISVIQ